MTARTLARAGLTVTAAFLLSRVLGWVRLVVIADLFGAGAELDAYFAAFRIPDLIYQLVAAGALSSALIPVLSGLLHRDEVDRAWRVVSSVVNLMLLGLAVFSVAMAVGAPVIVPAITPGFDRPTSDLTVHLTRIMLLSPVLLALGSVASSVLNTQGRFAAAAAAPLLYNAAIIVAALLLKPILGIDSLAVGVVLGSLLHLCVQLPQLRGRFRYERAVDLSDAAARQALLLMGPRAIGLGASQITFIVNTTLASTLGVGSIVAYNVAFTIIQIPIGIIGMPLGVVLLPSMSQAVAAGAMREFGALVIQSLRLLLYVMIFLTAVAMVLRRQVVALLFGYGSFDARALDLTSDTLLFFLAGMAGHSMIVVLARAFYSGQDTRTPVIAAIISVLVNVAVSLLSVGILGLSGLALGIAVGAWVEASFLAVLLWQRSPAARLGSLVRPSLMFAAGAFLAAVAAFGVVRLTDPLIGLDPGKLGLFLQVVVATGAASVVYVAYSRLLHIPELGQAVSLMRSAFHRPSGS